MKQEKVYLYKSINDYLLVEEMRNEVTMWYIAGALLLQFVNRKKKGLFGKLGFKHGYKESKPNSIEVLDVCSGPGNFPNYLSLFIPSIKVTCVDVNKKFVEFGNEHFIKWSFLRKDVVKMNLNRRFPIITVGSGYHHIKDNEKVKFLKNIKKHLKDDGLILMCDNFLPRYESKKDRNRSVKKYYKKLREYYKKGNASDKAIEVLSEVKYRDLNSIEEYKVSFEQFKDNVSKAGLKIETDINVWKPIKSSEAGSHVMMLIKT